MENYTAELVQAAKQLKSDMPITVIAFGNEEVIEQLQWNNVSVLIVSAEEEHEFEDAGRAKILANVFKEKQPEIILVPATSTAKSLFSRVSVLLDVGMTADATEIYMDGGRFKQKKPAFCNNAVVITEETSSPMIVTIVPGIYDMEESGNVNGIELINGHIQEQNIKVLEVINQQADSIVNSNRILSLGKGALADNGFDLALELADKMQAAIGGTRPLVDNGLIPFESQIGQTGCVIHPDICLFFGVSGAIQHTEGVRDSLLTVAINNDPEAAIFNFADYGIVADSNELMRNLLELWN